MAEKKRPEGEKTFENKENFLQDLKDEKSFDFVNYPILILDKDGCFIRINTKAKEVLKVTAEEIEGKRFDSVFSLKSLEDGKKPADMCKNFLKDGDIEMFSSFTEINQKKLAFAISKMSSAVKDPLGGFICFILALKEKHIGDTMDNFYRISSERIKTIINNIGEGIGIVNGEEVFVFSNPTDDKI